MCPRTEFTLSDGSPLTPQEQFVLKQAAAGEIADLEQEFGGAEEERRLRARFLEELLSGDLPEVRVHRRGVRIRHAVIQEPLDLENAEILPVVSLNFCRFKKQVKFEGACFNKDLELENSIFVNGADFFAVNIQRQFNASETQFLNPYTEANFNSLKVGQNTFFNNVIFQGPVDFGGAGVGGQFIARGAQFKNPEQTVNFNSLRVGNSAFFEDSVFHGPVNFANANITGDFFADRSLFKGQGKNNVANFNDMKVGQAAFFRSSVFNGYVDFSMMQIESNFHLQFMLDKRQEKTTKFFGPVNFGGSEINGQFNATGVQFQSPDQKANFNGFKVEQDAFFDSAVFLGPVDFSFADIGRAFFAKRTHFKSPECEASFNGMKVRGDAFFNEAEFRGQANFVSVQIRRQFGMRGAKFLSEKHKANFNGLKVGQIAFFDDSEFHGPVDFAGSVFTDQFVARGAKFLASGEMVSFNHMQVGQSAFFQGCDFHGVVDFILMTVGGNLYLEPLLKIGHELATIFRSWVNFHAAEIGGELWADKVQFLGHSDFVAVKVHRNFYASGAIFGGSAYFTEMAVKNNFRIDPFGRIKIFKTLFKGPADFSRLEVGGVFNADQAIFKSESTIFSGLKAGQGAIFNGAIFFGGLVLKEGQLTDLEIRGLHRLSVGGLRLDEIVLNRTKIAHRLTIEDIEVKRFDARNLEVKGPAELRRLAIKSEADLRDASLYHLQLVEPDWPVPQGGQKRVYLDGLTYQSLTTRSEPHKSEKWKELLGWLGLSRFNAQNFQEMDAFFQRGGLRKWADKVYIAGKRRELGKLPWWHPARWLLGFFWGLLAGFGRKPGRTFWPALVLVLLGWMVFHAAGQPLWTGLAVSLDRFLPGVDLGVAKAFQPANPSYYVWAYWHLEKIMGWVLAPIALAAIYTRIK
jgi:hypothetical protein